MKYFNKLNSLKWRKSYGYLTNLAELKAMNPLKSRHESEHQLQT